MKEVGEEVKEEERGDKGTRWEGHKSLTKGVEKGGNTARGGNGGDNIKKRGYTGGKETKRGGQEETLTESKGGEKKGGQE
ncbi:hypothetical protein PBY51_009057 [Eleginops maclovinus]|uniref:Uncharacterized protein n=1 Tax=Eleginops maclovinus TaxID=56733 RepID=A0AAN7WVA8_ELEMC|nr:hypothetical protein PBY51_009057 [Eleginops maclovinus]